MGTWGCDIFDDDMTMDIKDAFEDFLAEGLSVSEATRRILEDDSGHLYSTDDEPMVYLVLAALQLEHELLEPVIRDEALAVIDNGQGLAGYEESPELLAERKKALLALQEKLVAK